MIVLDTTIVNVALPSIRDDLGFSETSLAWVVNAYLLTFGGFLLLGGRLGDLYGQRRLFLAGIALFTVASLACGLATAQGLLIAARAVQGLGGAVVSAVALSLIMSALHRAGRARQGDGRLRLRAWPAAAAIGVLLGGVLTDALSWHWIFLVNVPIGVAVFVLSLRLLPAAHGQPAHRPARRRRRGDRHRGADARRLRDRQRQRGRLDARRRRSACSRVAAGAARASSS